nr:hypothetical protein Iba_chr04cCG15160 [Ipomoea batatas]
MRRSCRRKWGYHRSSDALPRAGACALFQRLLRSSAIYNTCMAMEEPQRWRAVVPGEAFRQWCVVAASGCGCGWWSDGVVDVEVLKMRTTGQ